MATITTISPIIIDLVKKLDWGWGVAFFFKNGGVLRDDDEDEFCSKTALLLIKSNCLSCSSSSDAVKLSFPWRMFFNKLQ